MCNALLLGMYFFEGMRVVPVYIAACGLTFINAIVVHSNLHRGPFLSHRVNLAWRLVLSFGSLYPASANIPTHNTIHHSMNEHGRPDFVHPQHVHFHWNLLTLLHFANVVGAHIFFGAERYARRKRNAAFRRWYIFEQVFTFGLLGVLMVFDF